MEDGGPAFPSKCAGTIDGRDVVKHQGMTLRDWFAAKAIQGLLGGPNITIAGPVQSVAAGLAVRAYEIADAMLAARKAP